MVTHPGHCCPSAHSCPIPALSHTAGTPLNPALSLAPPAQPVRIVNKEETQSPLEVLEGDSVTLVARLSPETAAAQWQKDGQMLCSGGRLLVCSEGPARSLTIKQVELGDSGIFLCDAGDDEVHFTLHVKGEPGGVPHPCRGQERSPAQHWDASCPIPCQCCWQGHI